MPNRLASESSPYLLQHQNNPVDWYPWGPEALERAQREDKPIFLSIGYSACHWCHVMEHESFEDPAIAELMNQFFVNIKVDREERPDLDQIYMHAVQSLTGRGGWPMSVFLTPDHKPFYGGTYFPPHSRYGMPGFADLLRAVHDSWQHRRSQALELAEQVTARIQEETTQSPPRSELSGMLLHNAAAALERQFDFTNGGFGGAPKFPHPMDVRLLLRVWKRQRLDGVLQMVTTTLDKMAHGGIYDHLGGGFHRYSVDAHWLVPHFEKMLYDNALLAGCYTEAFQATGNDEYAQVVRETLDYVLREMTHPEGGFYSTQDADSEGEEGKFYVWDPAEVYDVLGSERSQQFCRVYDVTEAGNFEGQNILNLPKTLSQCASILGVELETLRRELAEDRAKLLAERIKRVPPGLDDKVLVSWNALMIDALALASGALGQPRYLDAARKAADFVLRTFRQADGRLRHSWRGGDARFDAYLDDYAYLVNAFVTLYEASFEERWIDEATALADLMLSDFADAEEGGFFFTAAGHETLITRNKDIHDASVPSGNGMSATALLRLGRLTARNDYIEAAERTLELYSAYMERLPSATGQLLLAFDFQLGPTSELVLLGDPANADTADVLSSLRKRFLPHQVIASRSPGSTGGTSHLAPAFEGKTADEAPTLFVCQSFTCQAPVVGKNAILAELDRLEAASS